MSQPSPSTFLPPWLLGGIGRRLPQASADLPLLFSCDQPTPYPYLVSPLPLLLVSSLLALILFFTAPPILPVSRQNTGASQDHASDHVPVLPISLSAGPKLFLGSLEKLHLSQETPGRAQATSQQPPPLPPKMCRSVSVTDLKSTPLKPFQEGPSGRSLSQEDLLTEASANVVSHSSPEH